MKGESSMEFLFEFLFLIPETFFDLLCISGLTVNPRKERHFPGEEQGGIYFIARRMEGMTPEDRKQMIRFNNASFFLIALGTFVIGILTMSLMSAMSGWFWILGVAVEIVMAVWAYKRWKKKAMEMTERARLLERNI